MKKLMNKIRKSNKGFTLVELIIVVAIIAILTVAVAPQYLKYVEKSREASDLNAIKEVISTMSVVVADPANTISDGSLTMSVNASGVLTLTEGSPSTGVAALTTGMVSMPKIQSTDGKALSITVTIAKDGAGVSIPAGALSSIGG